MDRYIETVIHENSKRKHISVEDTKNNRVKYVLEFPDGRREDCVAAYPANADEYVWQPCDRDLCIQVRWIEQHSAEDVYRRLDDPSRYIIRQPMPGNKQVRWLAATKWSGGYEADHSLKSGLLIHVLSNVGTVLFTEQLIADENASDPVAMKKGPFSYEIIKQLAEGVKTTYGLLSYDDWKQWLISYKEKAGNTGENDNWLFCETALREQTTKIISYFYLGRRCNLIHEKLRHKIAGCEWDAFTLVSENGLETVAICGYDIIKEGELYGTTHTKQSN